MEKLKLNIQLFGGSLAITAYETDVSIENNTSYIYVELKPSTNSTTYNEGNTAYVQATLTGQNDTYTIPKTYFKIGKGKTVTAYSGKIGPFNHNADGTLNPVTINASCYIVSNTQPTASTSVTMSTIPRASTLGVADANIGSSTNITINKASSSFTSTLYYRAAGQSSFTKIVDKTPLQVYPWTVPTSFYSLIPNSRTITCEFYVVTFSGDTLVGISDWVTATFTANSYPTINSITKYTTDSTSSTLTGNTSTIINGVSSLYVSLSASAGQGSSIQSYTIAGVTQSGNSRTIANASGSSYSVGVTDGRYTTNSSFTMNTVNYIPLTIVPSIVRNQPTDGKVKISYSGNYFNSSFGSQNNTLTVQYRYVEKGQDITQASWNNLSPTKSGNTYSQNNVVISGFDYTKQYDFQIQAFDKIQTKLVNISVSKGQPVYWWNDEKFEITQDAKIIGVLDNTKIKSLVAKEDRPTTPNFDHQYPDDRASKRFDIVSSSMDSSGNKPRTDGWVETYFWDNSGLYDTQLFVPNGAGDLQIRSRSGGNWANNWLTIPTLQYGTWTPSVVSVDDANPTVTYSTRMGRYVKMGKLYYIDFYIRGKITALNGNHNYALINGLPFNNYASFGGIALTKGVLYSAVSNDDTTVFVVYGNGIRIQNGHGASAAPWIVTPTSYMEIGGSGIVYVE